MDDKAKDIYERGVAALEAELGMGDMIRFFQLLAPGTGNWAEERHAWMDSMKPGELTQKLRAMSNAASSKPGAARQNGKSKPTRSRRSKVKA